jgi:hypothetical protein
MGYMATLALYPGVAPDAMWQDEPLPRDILPPPALGRHGMTKARFNLLRQHVGQLYPASESSVAGGPWRFCDLPIRMFNEHMAQILVPGWLIGADEKMSPWTGSVCDKQDYGTAQQKPDDLPARDFVQRKPEPLGKELKETACGECGAIILSELMVPAGDHAHQEFADQFDYVAALKLRLTAPWHDRERKHQRVYGCDSHFAGVMQAEVMQLEAGMHFVGDVKTDTNRYPVKELQQWCCHAHGDHAVMSSILIEAGPNQPEVKVYAIGHRRGGEVSAPRALPRALPALAAAHRAPALDRRLTPTSPCAA